MQELVSRAQNYNSLTIEDKNSLVKDISQDQGLVSELIFSVPNVSFQEELLRYNLHKLKLIIYDGKIIGKLFREEIFSANIFGKEKTLVSVSGFLAGLLLFT